MRYRQFIGGSQGARLLGLVMAAAMMSGLALQAPAALAQDKAEEKNAWVKLCEVVPKAVPQPKEGETPAKPEKVNICITFAELREANSGFVLTAVAVKQIAGSDKEAVQVTVPHLSLLPAGAVIKIDDHDPVPLRFTYCHQAGCIAEGEATPEVVEQLKKGERVIVGAVDVSQKQFGFPLPLKGFTSAYDGEPVDSAKYQESVKNMLAQLRERRKEAVEKARAAKAAGQDVPKKE